MGSSGDCRRRLAGAPFRFPSIGVHEIGCDASFEQLQRGRSATAGFSTRVIEPPNAAPPQSRLSQHSIELLACTGLTRSISTGGPDFTLQFDGNEILDSARRYAYVTDQRAAHAGRRAQERGFYTKPEFMVVCRWKSPRSSGLAEEPVGGDPRGNEGRLPCQRRGRADARADQAGRGWCSSRIHPAALRLPQYATRSLAPASARALAISAARPIRSRFSLPTSMPSDGALAAREPPGVHVRTLDKALWQRSREASAEDLVCASPVSAHVFISLGDARCDYSRLSLLSDSTSLS